MCGISGVFGNKDFTTHTLDEMLGVIKHRGPDDQGELFEQDFFFWNAKIIHYRPNGRASANLE